MAIILLLYQKTREYFEGQRIEKYVFHNIWTTFGKLMEKLVHMHLKLTNKIRKSATLGQER